MNALSPFLRAAVPALALSLSAARTLAAPVQVDPAALALLQKVQVATQHTQSLSADASDIYFYHNPEREMRTVGKFQAMKPNYLREEQWIGQKNKASGIWEKVSDSMTNASDGSTVWLVLYGGEYRKSKADAHGQNMGSSLSPTHDFFDASQSVLAQVKQQQEKNQLIGLTYAGAAIWEGHSYHLVNWKYTVDYPFDDDVTKKVHSGIVTEKDRLYIGSNNLVYRVTYAYNIGWTGERVLRNVKVNAPLTAASFKFTLPSGAHLPVPPPALLAIGVPAPDFTATAPDGSQVHLSDYKGKTVVLDFWSTWCGPCQRSMPHLEKVYQSVKDKNVAVLGVCVWDKKFEYDKWVAEKKDVYHFPTAFDPAATQQDSIASKLYHVSGIPTQYVIDKDGKIAASTVGYDENGTVLEGALKTLGATLPEEKTATKP